MNNLDNFEKKVFENLIKFGILSENSTNTKKELGVAVSGGADSISLLTALFNISLYTSLNLKVITVNHYIRAEEETCGDVDFVCSYCKKLSQNNKKIEYFVAELKKGEVFELAKQRNCGIEEAARFLRYKEFDKFIKDKNLSYLCLAHNQNDQLETLIMRFLQGSSANYGILSQRGKYIRPILNCSRSEIEHYLTKKNISWRTDSTNYDTNFLRNKIRLKVIPFFNSEFPGWEKSVLLGAEKQLDESNFIKQIIENVPITQTKDGTEIFYKEILNFPESLQIQILLKMCNLCNEKNRIPHLFLKDVTNLLSEKKDFKKYYDNLEISLKNNTVFVKNYVKNETDLCFFDIIKEDGSYDFPFGTINFQKNEDSFCKIFINGIETNALVKLPICVRNSRIGDKILDSSGKYKKLSDIFSNWKVSEDERCYIPVIQDLSKNQNILCILGCAKGFNNWIVKVTS